MSIVGPDSIPECPSGALVTFRVNGSRATETALNVPNHSTNLDLTVG